MPGLAAEDFRGAQSIDNFYDGLAAFQMESSLTGYINSRGETVIGPGWDCGSLRKDRAWVKKDGAYPLIDSQDNTIGTSTRNNIYLDFGG